jgi:MFS family permease
MPKYKNYLLVLLTSILTFNYVDRTALGIVLQDIKLDLRLTDTQLGLLSGIAFALFYAVMGIPIARWADRGNRRTIIWLTTALWSAMVALCGAVMNFMQLLFVRIGVGVGEAGCIPPAHSLIADYFTRAERPRAMAIYGQGNNLCLVIGFFVAGWLSEWYGWRMMFVLIGLPGLTLAVLARFTLIEPRLAKTMPMTVGSSATPANPESDMAAPAQPSMKEVLVMLWTNATFRHMLLAFSVLWFFGYGILQWQPAFFVRSFGMNTGEVGTWFAVTYGLCGIVGTHWGGEWASRRAANNERQQLKVIAVINGGFNGVVWPLIYFSHNPYVAFVLMGLATLGGMAIVGPLFSTIQTLVPAPMRAMSIAVVFFSANLIGLGLGPLAAGMLSDALQPWVGQESLRFALLAFCPGYLWGSWHLWRASSTVTDDLEAMHQRYRALLDPPTPQSTVKRQINLDAGRA